MLTKKQIEQRKRGIPIGAVIRYEVMTEPWRLGRREISISRPSGKTYCIRGMEQHHRHIRVRDRFTTFSQAHTALLIYLQGQEFVCQGVDNSKTR